MARMPPYVAAVGMHGNTSCMSVRKGSARPMRMVKARIQGEGEGEGGRGEEGKEEGARGKEEGGGEGVGEGEDEGRESRQKGEAQGVGRGCRGSQRRTWRKGVR